MNTASRYIASLTLIFPACHSPRGDHHIFDVDPISFRELTEQVDHDQPEIAFFRAKGPFRTSVKPNQVIKVGSGDRAKMIVYDIAIPHHESTAPLVILSHGNMSRKEAHRYQIEHLASYGMYAMAVQLPNRDQWIDNGVALGNLVKSIRRRPSAIHASIAKGAIIVGGHSFGGSAAAIAVAQGAPVKGLILLDPALFKLSLRDQLERIKAPVIVLGADKQVFRARRRKLFYSLVAGEAAEISIKGATHDDAQFPSMFAVAGIGVDPFTDAGRQRLFAAAITASAFSLATTGSISFAYDALKNLEEVKHPKRRAAKSGPRDPLAFDD